MDDAKTKPGQTVKPTADAAKPPAGEVSVSIDHQAAKPEPAKTVVTEPSPAEQAKPTPVATTTAPAEQTVVTDPVVSETVPAEQPQTNQNDQMAEVEASGPDTFAFVDDEQATQEFTDEAYSWTASEFIAHEKTFGWYLGLVLVAALVSAIVFFITRDKISVGVVIFGAVFFAVFASHKPREMNYSVGPGGIDVGQKHFDFDDFKSFGVVPEGAFSSIVFMPHKRFAIPLSIYYPPEEEEKIANLVGSYLPMEEHSKDAVDRLLRSIRF